MAEHTEKKTPRDFLRMVCRSWWLFILSAVTVMIVFLLVSPYIWTLKYTGETKFERRVDAAAEQTKGGGGSFGDLKPTLEEDLAGREAVTQVAEELKLLEGLPHDDDGQLTREGKMARAAIVRDLMGSITVDFEVEEKKVDIVAVSVTYPDAKLAQRIPNALVQNYIDRISERTRFRLTESRKFLVDQVNGCKGRMNDAALAKAKFEAAHANAMPSDPGALNRRINTITGEIEALRIRQETAKLILSRLNELRPTSQPAEQPTSQPTSQPTTRPVEQPIQIIMGPNPELARLKNQLRDLEEVLVTQLLSKTEKHPNIVILREKIKQVQKRIAEAPEEVVIQRIFDPRGQRVGTALLAQMAMARSELETVAREIERLEKRREPLLALMTNFAKTHQDYMMLVEKLSKERLELETWEKRYNAVQMELAAEVAKRGMRLEPKQAAEEQEFPSSPSLIIVLGSAIAVGLAIGAALVFLKNKIDRSITSVTDAIHRFHVPVHGIISEIVSRRRRFARRLNKRVLLPGVMLLAILALGLSSMSVWLWLRNKEKYTAWQAEPIVFVVNEVSSLKDKLLGQD